MDRTNGKFGKFRPFMAIGNIIMAVSYPDFVRHHPP